ncbi:MAG: hypothetical protein LBO73_00290 [Holosporaceae bacterium]|jgi:hypothetical protein|nr:hypothetical protein [Holosporaceae bacterium]
MGGILLFYLAVAGGDYENFETAAPAEDAEYSDERNGDDSLSSDVVFHEQKLRQHFSGKRMGDISTLISETRNISSRLKAAGMPERANTFDSYIDVLTYGHRTIDESLDDVMKLVHKK